MTRDWSDLAVVTAAAQPVADVLAVCRDLGLTVQGVLTGVDIEALDDAHLAAAIPPRRCSPA